MAGTWKQVMLLLKEIKEIQPHIPSGGIPAIMKKNQRFRDRFILLYRLMEMLVYVHQKTVSLATAGSPFYAHYFVKISGTGNQTAYMAFKQSECMGAIKSLIDTIVMELVLPDSEYPLHILLTCLKESLDANPQEAKRRFNQSLYNAIGDLSESVRFYDMLDTALVGPESVQWKTTIPPYTDAFDAYLDAEWLSIKASRDNKSLRELVSPLKKSQDPKVLEQIWKNINMAYIAASGFDIDKTWQLEEDRNPTPQWSYTFEGVDLYFDDDKSDFTDEDEDEKLKTAVVLHSSRKGKRGPINHPTAGGKSANSGPSDVPVKYKGKGVSRGRKLKQITQGGEDEDEEPPPLLSPSGSEDSDEDEESDEEHIFNVDVEGMESGYDTEEGEELDRMFRKAMDDLNVGLDDLVGLKESLAKEEATRKSAGKPPNPFIKMFNKLTGRFFSTEPALNSTRFRPTFGPPRPPPKPKPVPAKSAPVAESDDEDLPPLVPIGPNGKPLSNFRTTVEEVSDEDDGAEEAAKKKKKKKKKPNKKKGASEPILEEITQPASPQPGPASPATSTAKSSSKTAPKASSSTASSSVYGTAAQGSAASYSSLLHPTVSGVTAQSGHSYLSQNMSLQEKTKIKTRPTQEVAGPNGEPPIPDKMTFGKKIKSLFSREEKKEAPEPTPDIKPFNVPKKMSKFMQQLFRGPEDERMGKGSMRWEHFVKTMQQLGFTYVPNTAGSSVRFDPPSPKDKPITFHKPHPDSTLTPVLLHDFRRRLHKQYGWTKDLFVTKAAEVEDEVEEID
ncbi:hypothetical protein FRC02_011431 [Tulasnella sp. 418]|nr:hypothetical protein FRC02_011431 [Tulasnella sp. 418]